jgi:hypothetical protein
MKLLSATFFFTLSLLALAGIPDEPFWQEYHVPYPLPVKDANDVRSIAVDSSDRVWAGTKAGLFFLDQAAGKWQAALSPQQQGPVFDLYIDKEDILWAAAWNGLYRLAGTKSEKVAGVKGPVSVVGSDGITLITMGPAGLWKLKEGKWHEEEMPFSREDRCLLTDLKNGYYLGTGRGVWHVRPEGTKHYWMPAQLISDDIRGMDYSPEKTLWIGGLGGITVYTARKDQKLSVLTPAEGLTDIRVTCVKRAPAGAMWIGTERGVVRFRGMKHSLRHGRRWLLDDRVRDIAFDSRGDAWVATAGGVSALKKKKITLEQKAACFEDLLLRRHVRKPWLVEKCRLRTPGDTTTWQPMDDDNDGQYTSMYLAMESYRYAVTHDTQARENAVKAFRALKFLQTVTGTDGFVARTVIPVTWKHMADPNETISDRQYADRLVRNPRDKRVEKHWRRSADGKWLWKGDTSSDEITGHMYGYTIFWETIAKNDPQLNKEVSNHITKIIDYIIDGGYVLKDLDGTHTKWGVWAPEYLNGDPEWATERGINSLEILSYLKLAYEVSGKEKYQKEYERLIREHHYAENALQAKTIMPGWRTFIDDELVALAYPALMLYEKDEELKTLYKKSMDNWHAACKNDDSPFYYYTYNAFRGKEARLDRSVLFLRDNPLDLIRWTVDNSWREDLTLTHKPILEDTEISRLVPPGERGIMRWDKNPWKAVQGDGGRTEASPTFWLLPYWMGRYYGYIQ